MSHPLDFDGIVSEIQTAAAIAVIESGNEVGLDDAAHDITLSYLADLEIHPNIRHALARSFLGWDPEFDEDLYERHNVPKEEV